MWSLHDGATALALCRNSVLARCGTHAVPYLSATRNCICWKNEEKICEGCLGKVKAHITGSCCLHVSRQGRVLHSKKSNEQTGRELQAGHRLNIRTQRSVTNQLGMMSRWSLGYTLLSLLKQLARFMLPHEKAPADSWGQALLTLWAMGSCLARYSEPDGNGDAGLVQENKPLSSALWQHSVIAAQLSL